ncbi:hypothetical protein [Longimicrobium sp.]|uniref:hypothetical protein n=1 Tax=Longimicrobium sp. TaxID=2029185 RepID=UPI002E36F646|nr:hypothetical protein [Longimicrobium sp.]HEX6038875.1 hypothetical protein [Longimicrobium sp.]
MKIGSAFPSNYLKHEDLGGRNVLVTIESVRVEEIRGEGGKENKPVLYFVGKEKGLVLNKTNAETLTEILGTDETDDWHGCQVVLYHDRNVSFGGKRVGGIRIAPAPKPANGKRPQAPPPPVTEDVPPAEFQATDDDILF